MDTETIIARIEELNDIKHDLQLQVERSRLAWNGVVKDVGALFRIVQIDGEIKGLQNELCERDVHDFEDEVREFGDGGEIHFIVCQSCGNREQNGVVEPDEEDWPPAE